MPRARRAGRDRHGDRRRLRQPHDGRRLRRLHDHAAQEVGTQYVHSMYIVVLANRTYQPYLPTVRGGGCRRTCDAAGPAAPARGHRHSVPRAVPRPDRHLLRDDGGARRARPRGAYVMHYIRLHPHYVMHYVMQGARVLEETMQCTTYAYIYTV